MDFFDFESFAEIEKNQNTLGMRGELLALSDLFCFQICKFNTVPEFFGAIEGFTSSVIELGAGWI